MKFSEQSTHRPQSGSPLQRTIHGLPAQARASASYPRLWAPRGVCWRGLQLVSLGFDATRVSEPQSQAPCVAGTLNEVGEAEAVMGPHGALHHRDGHVPVSTAARSLEKGEMALVVKAGFLGEGQP